MKAGVRALLIAASTPLGVAHAATLTVCASGCPHTSIQGAISKSSDGDTISILKGHYFETVNTEGKALTLQGSDPREVIVDANGTGTVITVPGSKPVAISNLTITRGYGEAGGVWDSAGAPLTISNSVVTGNYGNFEGGGIGLGSGSAADSHGPITITNCTISANYGGQLSAGVLAQGPNVTIENSTIAGNTNLGNSWDSAGIAVQAGVVQVKNSNVVDNVGGGVSTLGGTLIVSQSTIAGNFRNGEGGGVAISGGDVTLETVVVTRNSGSRGGGLFASPDQVFRGPLVPASLTLANTYFIGNSATIDGGGTNIDQGTKVTAQSVVLAGNSPDNCGSGTICP
jgi:hypothetical protein